MNTGRLFAAAWAVLGRLPIGVIRVLFAFGADVTWLLRGRRVRQLEANLARVSPGLSRRGLRTLSRAGMRSYMRYYAEAFCLPRLGEDRIAAMVRPVDEDRLRVELAAGRSVVLALGHLGNWDLAGAWATRHLGPVVTVAERLEPEELFQEFLDFRTSLGMRIFALERGGGQVFRDLVHATNAGGVLVPLLADRDLTSRGVEVDLFGHRARVAAGPAALAEATGAVLIPAALTYERLTGARRAAAGSPWGLVIEFFPPVARDHGAGRAARVAAMTQGWVDVLAGAIAEAPQDWHMLQKVFVADLDRDRDAAVRGDGAAARGDAARHDGAVVDDGAVGRATEGTG